MKYLASLFLGCWLCVCLACADDIQLSIKGDTTTLVKTFPITLSVPAGDAKKTLYDWSIPDGIKADGDGPTLTVTAAPQGEYMVRVRITTWQADGFAVSRGSFPFCVGTPTPPVPPVPPGPNPPVPPTPTPAPIPIQGLAVLIVYETMDEATYPVGQIGVLFGATVRGYLDAKCAADPGAPNGKAYRIWDKDVVMTHENKVWQDAMKRPRPQIPWLVISNPATGGGFEGPLPQTVTETMTLLKKFGG